MSHDVYLPRFLLCYNYKGQSPTSEICRVIGQNRKEITVYNENLVLNIQRQIEKLRKKGKEVNSYFDLPYPEFNGQVVITSADDNLEKGQFRRLKVDRNFLTFEIKVPMQDGWKWITVKKLLPDRLRKALLRAKEKLCPIILIGVVFLHFL